MILFRDVYKAANNDIVPDSQLLDKILENKQKKHSALYSTYYKYSSIAAACLILIGTLSIYPKISDYITPTKEKASIDVSTQDGISKSVSENSKSETFTLPDTPEAEVGSLETAPPVVSNPQPTETPHTVKNTEKNKTQAKKAESAKKNIEASPESKVKKPSSVSENPYPNYASNSINLKEEEKVSAPVVQSVQTPSVSPDLKQETNTLQKSEENSSETISPQKSDIALASVTEEAIQEATSAYSPQQDTTNDLTISGGGGSSAKASSGGSVSRAVPSSNEPEITKNSEPQNSMTEDEAKKIANEVFSSDFGDEFITSTQIKVEHEENYVITRYDETKSYAVTVFADGSFEKKY